MTKLLTSLWAACLIFAGTPALAQYSRSAGQNAPSVQVVEQQLDHKSGKMVDRVVEREASKDRYGNAQGNQFDLAVDGAFDGQTVAVIQLYQFPFELPRAALKEKGFSVYRWTGAPSPEDSMLRQSWTVAPISSSSLAAHLSRWSALPRWAVVPASTFEAPVSGSARGGRRSAPPRC